jgi:hypothetical protein
MAHRVCGALLTLVLGITLASAAGAQQRPRIAIMPTQSWYEKFGVRVERGL